MFVLVGNQMYELLMSQYWNILNNIISRYLRLILCIVYIYIFLIWTGDREEMGILP